MHDTISGYGGGMVAIIGAIEAKVIPTVDAIMFVVPRDSGGTRNSEIRKIMVCQPPRAPTRRQLAR